MGVPALIPYSTATHILLLITARNPQSTNKSSLLVYCAKMSAVCSSMLVVIGYLVTETAFRKSRKSFLISGLLLVAIFAVFLFLFF